MTTILFSIGLLKCSPDTVYLLPKLTLYFKCLYCIVKNHEAHSVQTQIKENIKDPRYWPL